MQAVQAYWHEENTARKVELEFSKRYGYVPPKAFAGAGVGNCDCRVAGTNLDFEKLIRLGFDGLDQEIDRAAEVNGASSFYTALKLHASVTANRHWSLPKKQRPKKPKRALQSLPKHF